MIGPGAIVGIDLGTAASRVAVYGERGAIVVENGEGARATPSAIALTADRRALVGSTALRQAHIAPQTVVAGAKRLVGRAWDPDAMRALRATWPHDLVKAPSGEAWLRVGTAPVSPAELQARLIEALVAAATRHLGLPVTRAVIAVPAGFDEPQRRATRDAGAQAGVEVVRLLGEPIAAALAYGFERRAAETIAVVDFGAGGFEATIVRAEDGVFEVLGSAGDLGLGGEELDRRIAAAVRDDVHAVYGVDVQADPVAAVRLAVEAGAVKRSLSEAESTVLGLPNLAIGSDGPITVVRAFARAELDALASDLVERAIERCRDALADARVVPGAIDAVVAVGGMTRAPIVRRAITALFGREPARGVHPEEAVALGAAIESAVLDGRVADVALIDRASHTVGVRASADRFVPLIRRGAVVPARVRKVVATSEDDQAQLIVEVLQGEDAAASRNRPVGRFRVTELPPGARGDVHLELCFTVDAGGCFALTARDVDGGHPCAVEPIAARTALAT